MEREREYWGKLHTAQQSEADAGASMSATMASTISHGVLRQRRRSRDGTWYLPWRLGELITEKTDQMDPTPRRHGCKCLLSGYGKGKCRECEVSQNMSERTLGSIRTVPFTATVFCNVVDFALVQHAIISQLEAHAQCRTARDRTFACAK
ncbi:hypothetical protein Q7P36_011153 [Cladosporium allicinum]